MTPNTDYSPAIANTLAIIQGRESLSSLIDELDSAQYEHVYDVASELDNDGYYSTLENGQYQTKKHATKWLRRVR